MIDDMYRDYIIELYSNPLNFGVLKDATFVKAGHNVSCGDKLVLQLKVEDDKIIDAKFEGKGCAIHMASSSLLTQKIIGMKVEDALKITNDEVVEELNIEITPVRLKCALLVYDTLKEMLEDEKC